MDINEIIQLRRQLRKESDPIACQLMAWTIILWLYKQAEIIKTDMAQNVADLEELLKQVDTTPECLNLMRKNLHMIAEQECSIEERYHREAAELYQQYFNRPVRPYTIPVCMGLMGLGAYRKSKEKLS